MEETQKMPELTPEQKEAQKKEILKKKEAIREDTGIAIERQDELSKIITKPVMNFIKEKFKENEVNLDIERAFVCYTLKEKFDWLTTLYYLGSVEVKKGDAEDGESGKEA